MNARSSAPIPIRSESGTRPTRGAALRRPFCAHTSPAATIGVAADLTPAASWVRHSAAEVSPAVTRPGQRMKGATMTIRLIALVLLGLMTGPAAAQEPKVTPLMSKDLPENPGKEALMIMVEHAPGGSSAIHRHNAHAFVYVLEGSVVMQLKGGPQVT